jgi:hypothetical protein
LGERQAAEGVATSWRVRGRQGSLGMS